MGITCGVHVITHAHHMGITCKHSTSSKGWASWKAEWVHNKTPIPSAQWLQSDYHSYDCSHFYLVLDAVTTDSDYMAHNQHWISTTVGPM